MRPTGQLEKSLAALTIAIDQGHRERATALEDSHTGEHFQQVRVDLSGNATAVWGFSDTDVAFALPFLYAPSQRAVPFKLPHFTHGIEFKVTPESFVLLNAQVVGWHETEEGWIVGAKVRFAVCAPNFQAGGAAITFSATAHLTFQGYATYAESEEFDT